MGTSEASEKWEVPAYKITDYCRKGKIKGAEQDGYRKPWRIPVNTPNPFKKEKGEKTK